MATQVNPSRKRARSTAALKDAIKLHALKKQADIATSRTNLRGMAGGTGDGVMGYPSFTSSGVATNFLRIKGRLLPWRERENAELEKEDRKEFAFVIGSADDAENPTHDGFRHLHAAIQAHLWGTFEKAIDYLPSFAVGSVKGVDHPLKKRIVDAAAEVEKTKQPPLQKSSAITSRVRMLLDGAPDAERESFLKLADAAIQENEDAVPLRLIKGTDGITEPGLLVQYGDNHNLLLRLRAFHAKSEVGAILPTFETTAIIKNGERIEDSATVDEFRSDEIGSDGVEAEVIVKMSFWVNKRATINVQYGLMMLKYDVSDEDWLLGDSDREDEPSQLKKAKTVTVKKATVEDDDDGDEW